MAEVFGSILPTNKQTNVNKPYQTEAIQGVVSPEDSNLNHYEQKTRRSNTAFTTKKKPLEKGKWIQN